MTKKHFIALADTLRLPGCMRAAIGHAVHRAQFAIDPASEVQIPTLTQQQEERLTDLVLEAVARELADFCIDQNSRFDRQRWLGYIAGSNGPNGGAR